MIDTLSPDFPGVVTTVLVGVCVTVAHATVGARRVGAVLVLAAIAGWSDGGGVHASLLALPTLGIVCLMSLVLVFALARPLRARHPIPALVVVVFAGGALGATLAGVVAGVGVHATMTEWVVPAMVGLAAAQLATIVVTALVVFRPGSLAVETGVSAPDRLPVSRIGAR
jgi:hypothetical protein